MGLVGDGLAGRLDETNLNDPVHTTESIRFDLWRAAAMDVAYSILVSLSHPTRWAVRQVNLWIPQAGQSTGVAEVTKSDSNSEEQYKNSLSSPITTSQLP